jgi:hypothetical protein
MTMATTISSSSRECPASELDGERSSVDVIASDCMTEDIALVFLFLEGLADGLDRSCRAAAAKGHAKQMAAPDQWLKQLLFRLPKSPKTEGF